MGGATGLKCNFFLLQICNKVPGEKTKRRLVAPPTGDRTLSPTPGATDPYRHQGGRSPLLRATGGPVAPPPHTGDRVRPPI